MATAPWIHPELTKSYHHLENYPMNLWKSLIYQHSLQARGDRLAKVSSALCSNIPHVPFWDLNETGDGFNGKNIFDDAKLKDWLGDETTVDDQGNVISGSWATRPDPKCRFMFLWAENSRAPRRIQQRMLKRILSYHQVTPYFLDFLFLYGQQANALDLRYSGFREITQLAQVADNQKMPDLRRSGRRYELCYNLKTVQCTQCPPASESSWQWNVRQISIYHSMDVEYGTSTWILITPKSNLHLKNRIKQITGKDGRLEDRSFHSFNQSLRSSLAVHSLLAHWSSDDWRWYIQWLEKVVESETVGAICGDRDLHEDRNDGREPYTYSSKNLQNVQFREEKINEAVMVMDANSGILTSFLDYYMNLNKTVSIDTDVNDAIEMFTTQVRNSIQDLKMQASRARLLAQITSQRKVLILQHMQSQASEKMERLATFSQKEAVAMRIVALLTLVYLPATFVSSFFSTDVVKYQNQNGDGNAAPDETTSFSTLALYRWLQISLPLTALTFFAAFVIWRREKKNMSLREIFTGSRPEESPDWQTPETKV